MQASFNDAVIAENDDTIAVEGNHYLPWHYPKPTFLARRVKGRVAFWGGIQVRPTPPGPTP